MENSNQSAIALNSLRDQISPKELEVIQKRWEIMDPDLGSLSSYISLTVEFRPDMLSEQSRERLKGHVKELIWNIRGTVLE